MRAPLTATQLRLALGGLIGPLVRRCVYNRWFLAGATGSCALNVLAGIMAAAFPAEPAIPLIANASSTAAALAAALLSLDLQFRNARM